MKPFSTPVLSKRTYRELKLLKHLKHENVCHNTAMSDRSHNLDFVFYDYRIHSGREETRRIKANINVIISPVYYSLSIDHQLERHLYLTTWGHVSGQEWQASNLEWTRVRNGRRVLVDTWTGFQLMRRSGLDTSEPMFRHWRYCFDVLCILSLPTLIIPCYLSILYANPFSYFVTELLGTDLHRLLTSRPLDKQFIQYFLYQILVRFFGYCFLSILFLVRKCLMFVKVCSCFVIFICLTANCSFTKMTYRLVEGARGQLLSSSISFFSLEKKKK